MSQKVEIRTNGRTAKILLEGQDITAAVRGYEIKHSAGGRPTIRLEIVSQDLSLQGDMLPVLPEPWSKFFVAKDFGEGRE